MLHFVGAHKVVVALVAAVLAAGAWVGVHFNTATTFLVAQTTDLWPVTVAGWVALVSSVVALVGGGLVLFKGWVIFRKSILDGFEKLDEKIGLAKGTTVVSVIDGQGRRIDELSKRLTDGLATVNGLPEDVRNLQRESLAVIKDIADQHAEVKACLEDARTTTGEAREILHAIDKRLIRIETTLGNGGYARTRTDGVK